MAENMDFETPMIEEIANTSSDFLEDQKCCDPCMLSEKESTAMKYCNDCEEKLCDACAHNHSKRKATSTHDLIKIQDMMNNAEDSWLCTPCADIDKVSKADTFCKECEENLCAECTKLHKKRKATRLHEPVDVEYLKSQSRQSDELISICKPCEHNGSASPAVNYCKECDETLCDSCTEKHMRRKATKSHKPVPVTSLQQEQDGQVEPDKMCDPCLCVNRNEKAASFCKECEELLCTDCSARHRVSKLTESHSLKSPDLVEYVNVTCKICNNRHVEAAMFCSQCEETLCELCAKKHSSHKLTKHHTLAAIKGTVLKQIILCDLCKENEEVKKADTYCILCNENFCESCTTYHKGQTLTKQHELSTPKEPALNESLKRDVKCCDQCTTGGNALKYCVDCQGYVCSDCCKAHERSKLYKTHELIEIGDVSKIYKRDCNFCDKLGGAESYCNECDEFYCKNCSRQHQSVNLTRTHQLVSAEEIRKEGSTRAGGDNDNTNLSELLIGNKRDAVENEAKKTRPGKPEKLDVFADSITLSWDPPASFGEDNYYQISFKEVDQDKKWKFFHGEFEHSTAVLNDLKSNTAFIFRVRVVYEDGEGPYSEYSETISTSSSPATRIINESSLKQAGNPSPSKYVLPMTEIMAARNEKAKTRKFVLGTRELGSPPAAEDVSRTIMLVGAKGTGKSTLVDGIVNYVLGVNWDDPFRFTIIDLEQEEKDREKNQALSQTEWITCYTLNPGKGSRLKCQLNIIDTPGFGDTLGLKRDQEIVEQIRQLFSEKQPMGVTLIDAVCFLIKAQDARLTAVQSYIFQSVISLFGKDIEQNICSLITFADGKDPPVLAALSVSGLPFGKSFTFNNSDLYAKNVDINASSLSPMFWDMGLKSFRAFFDHLGKVETKSLLLTKDVLDERFRLEATIRNLQPQLDAGLLKVNCLKQEIRIFEQNKYLMKDNNFEYEVEEIHQKKSRKLPSQEEVVEKLGVELGELLDTVEDMMVTIKSCTKRLEEIALRPNPLTMTEHIDLMIQHEKLEKKEGFLQRIYVLNTFRKRSQICTEFEQFKNLANATLGSVGKKKKT